MTIPRDVLKFLTKIPLFSPLLLIFVWPFFILYASGELLSIPQAIRLQADCRHPVLIGEAYTNFGPFYKLKSTIGLHPDVLALGASRIDPMRSAFFNRQTKFYNASESIYKMADYNTFLDAIPLKGQPKVIILCLDSAYFLNNWEEISPYLEDFSDTTKSRNIPIMMQMMKDDYQARKFFLKDIFSLKRVGKFGLSAIIHHDGFRNDGSRRWGSFTEDPSDHVRQDKIDADLTGIYRGHLNAEFNTSYSAGDVHELVKFLADCAARHIYVVGYYPPFMHLAYQIMRSFKDKEATMFKLPLVLSGIFHEFHYSFFNFSDLASVGASDNEVYDAYHASEKAYLRLFLIMIAHDETLRSYARDPAYLEMRLNQARGPFTVFREDEF